ncbi:hypothetical protein C7380_103153 [Oceanotoga teriensis]|uniref:Uncharacterized protein n=1 Tax=Oceanotoga teriensis TaxID=515440 RepID=A0AA45HJE5_9BACT|nr:hypothetical protein [Oceanotoga teriensis]PWJ95974.1 hypothetical protein C7380_103153 [Oceanotoga teriensis]
MKKTVTTFLCLMSLGMLIFAGTFSTKNDPLEESPKDFEFDYQMNSELQATKNENGEFEFEGKILSISEKPNELGYYELVLEYIVSTNEENNPTEKIAVVLNDFGNNIKDLVSEQRIHVIAYEKEQDEKKILILKEISIIEEE